MRLKTFAAKSMQEAMAQVRDAMGPDAIIVSVEQSKKAGGVRVTAAVEAEALPVRAAARPAPPSTPAFAERQAGPRAVTREFDPADLKAAAQHHGLPFDLAERLMGAAQAFSAASLAEAMAAALETLIGFAPIAERAPRPLMLIGPPGAGKTVSAAKLAAQALVAGSSVRLITTDTLKSSGVEQLDAYANLMDLPLVSADGPEALAHAVKGEPADLTLIDSCGINPFAMEELERLLHLLHASGAEPVPVLPAGLDPHEAADIAGIFAEMGAKRFIATRLDSARRYASVLTTARGGRLALAAVSRSPYVAEPLETATPLLLARLLAALPAAKFTKRVKERIA